MQSLATLLSEISAPLASCEYRNVLSVGTEGWLNPLVV